MNNENSDKKKRVFVSCGEMSGDLHLSYIIKNILKINKNIEFRGVVGDRSIEAGAIKVNHINDNDIMGFVEVFKKYSYFKKKAYEYIEYIKKYNIQTVIFVDFGGFNLRFFKLIKKELPYVKTIYYIPPKVWAWGKKRIKTLKEFDEIIVIFPFEKKYFESIKMDVKYFGNPLIDKYKFSDTRGEKILLLPGSRKQEIRKFIPEILEYMEGMKNQKFILKLAHKSHLDFINNLLKNRSIKISDISKIKNLEIYYGDLSDVRQEAKFCIATSGTVTFETFLMGLPSIVVYKTSGINAFIAKKILKIKYITLININSGKEIFPELLQKKFTAKNLLDVSFKFQGNLDRVVYRMKEELKNYGEEGVLDKISNYLIEVL